jgi:hypothetical protein
MNVTEPLFLLDFGPVAFPILHGRAGLGEYSCNHIPYYYDLLVVPIRY